MWTLYTPVISVASMAEQIVEVGCHEELLARPGGAYAKLYSLQIFEERTDQAVVETQSPVTS